MTRSRIIAVASVVFLVMSGGSAGLAAASQQSRVMPGISVAGIAVDGLSPSETLARVQLAARIAENRSILFRAKDRSWTRNPAELGIRVDVARTMREAMIAGRENPIAWLLHTLEVWKHPVRLVPRVDQNRFNRALSELADTVRVEVSNGEVSFDGPRVVVRPPSEGVTLSQPQTGKLLMERSLDMRVRELSLPVTTTPPKISNLEIGRIRAEAERLLMGPTQMSFTDVSFEIPPESLAKTLRVAMQNEGRLHLSIDTKSLQEEIKTIAPNTHTPPTDARFVVENDRVRTIPSVPGQTINAEAAAASVLSMEASPIDLQAISIDPEFTTEMARALGIVQKVATYTTTFDSRNAPRVANIDLMAKAIDHTVLEPGDTFSLNDTTGPRTPNNGYKEAQIIVDGELVPGIGGGVCQVATTVFNAVFMGGYEVLSRTNHSLHISKYPLGRDATVNYGLQDLKFRNDSPFGMLIKTYLNSRGITVVIYSTNPGRTIETTTSERRNPKEPPIKYVDDPSLPGGQEVVEVEGSPGFDVTVTRKVLANGAVLHSDTFVSKYRAWKRIVRRGTGPPAESPSPAESP